MSPLTEPTRLVLRKTWQPMDPDAAAYITAVEAADTAAGQTGGLEERVKIAIDNFVLGCKADGIWSAIKASCILAGARTLQGALVPLVGAAPTSFNFVAGDYNRETGLIGDGATKYLDTNRANNADPQNNAHHAIWISASVTSGRLLNSGLDNTTTGTVTIAGTATGYNLRNRSNLTASSVGTNTNNHLACMARSQSSQFVFRTASKDLLISQESQAPTSSNIFLYQGANTYAACRLAFYSIGESLNLALLDARVTTLINAIGASIP